MDQMSDVRQHGVQQYMSMYRIHMSEYLWLTSQYQTSDGMSLSTFTTVLYLYITLFSAMQLIH